MFLLDTDVITEARKKQLCNAGVKQFYRQLAVDEVPAYLSVITQLEINKVVTTVKRRGDYIKSYNLHQWIAEFTPQYRDHILPFDDDDAIVCGTLCAAHCQSTLDSQIAAIALLYDLTVVTKKRPFFVPWMSRLTIPLASHWLQYPIESFRCINFHLKTNTRGKRQ